MCNLGDAKNAKAANRKNFATEVGAADGFRGPPPPPRPTPAIYDLCEVRPPRNRGRNIKDVAIVEGSIPPQMSTYTEYFSAMGPILHTKRGMVNESPEAGTRAEASPPPYKPYIDPDYASHHWPRPELPSALTLSLLGLALWGESRAFGTSISKCG